MRRVCGRSSGRCATGLHRVANSTEAIVQSLHLMVETQATHGEMLRVIPKAAAEPVRDSPLADTLCRIHATLQTQTDALVRLRAEQFLPRLHTSVSGRRITRLSGKSSFP
jgi:hypothetical protein